ncbi:MAG: HK97 family phage prohead protease, partial [Atopobiaceae bacterium]|nr:HK97 family phage prohead protease [Atopobiaceae bacterium]
DDPEYNIGKVVDAYEDERGLFVRAEFDADNPKAQYVRKLVKEGRLYQFSFAYQVLDAGTVELDSGLEAYELRKLDIFEVSLVQIPANQHAEVVEVKAATPEVKSGRRNSKADEDELRRVLDMANQIETIVQSLIGDEQDEPEPEPEDKPEEPEEAKGEDSTAKDALAQLKDEADRLLRQ